MGGGVAGEIGQGALEGQRADGGGQALRRGDLDLGAGATGVLARAGQQVGDRHLLRRLPGLAAGEGEVFVDHVLHLVEVPAHGGGALEGGREGELEAETGQGRAQVVADRGEQGGALVDVPLDAVAHVHEGLGGGADLPGTRGLEALARLAPAEGLRRLGEAFDGADLVADEQDGDAHQQDGGDEQPEHEDVGLGRDGALARGDDAQHALGLLHPNVDVGRVAGGVEPEGLVQPVGEGLLERAVDDADRPAPGLGRQDVAFAQVDGERHRPLGAFGDDLEVLRGRVVGVALDRPGDVAGQAVGEAGGDGLPVGVEEGPGHRHLHDQHRQDDDQQRAAPERGRQAPLEETRPEAGGEQPHDTPPPPRGEGDHPEDGGGGATGLGRRGRTPSTASRSPSPCGGGMRDISPGPACSRRRGRSGGSAGSWGRPRACGAGG